MVKYHHHHQTQPSIKMEKMFVTLAGIKPIVKILRVVSGITQ
jgi:hypothetical protein